MIKGINGNSYNAYAIIDEQVQNRQVEETQKTKVNFNIQEILNQINEYTYTQQDREAVDGELVESLTEKFDLKEEEIYELYKRGVDLDELNMQEISYRRNVKSSEAEDKKAQQQEDKTLEEKIETIKKQNDQMYLNALSHEGSITINSLYENNFKGDFKKGISQYTKQDVENVLSMNGLEANKENTWAANLLMMYDMGVSPTSIQRLQGIQSAVATLDSTSGLSGDDELIKNGQVQYQPEYVDRITDDLGMVTDEHIEKLIEEKQDITIENLRESIHKNASEALESNHSGNSNQGAEENFDEGKSTSQSVDTVKKQILQITTKLTVEAAQKISTKMPLESSSLQAVAEALTQMEQEMAVSALEQVNLPATTENIEAITNTMNVVDQMSGKFITTDHIEMETGEAAPLSEISVALASYRENETPVETRFGESIKTVENQIGALLESQGIEATTTHIEAAKALITNHIEVTAEEIQKIQDIVMKLNTFLEDMTPIQVATMIKEGFNPYHASVNEILSWMTD